MTQAFPHVYVSNAESNTISVFHLDSRNGDLILCETAPIPVDKPGMTTPIAISPDRRFLFVGIRSEPFTVASYSMDPASGKLTHIANGPLADAMPYIFVDRTGRFLLSASFHGSKVSVNPIGPDGVVGKPQQVFATQPKAHAILTDPANRFAFVPSLGGDIVHQYRFDAATGQLSPNDPPFVRVKEKSGPRHFRFHPNGKYVYLLNELNASLYLFDYDAARGQWLEKDVVSFVPPSLDREPWGSDLQLTPDGRFLYAAERNASMLAAFKVDPVTGKLTLIGHYPTEKQPRGFKIDPAGRYLLAVGQLSHRMTSYSIDQSAGTLTRLKDYPVGQNPNWIEIIDRSYPA